MGISAADVKQLREKTGAGMLDCKKALTEADGNFEKAEKILKELGLAAAAKRSGRATNEGRIFTAINGDKAGVLEITCETDFVARNDDFKKLGQDLITRVMNEGLTEMIPALEARVQETISTIKENITLRRFYTTEITEDEMVVDYIHGEGSIGVLVKLKADSSDALKNEKVKEFAFDCALHIAAFNPLYLDQNAIDEGYLKEQEEIFKKQAENLGKPEKVIPGIVKGKLNKHLSEICFLNQGFVKDDKQSVSRVLEQVSKEVGSKISIAEYAYYKVGSEL
ncbi:MAG: elongation factor Ts [Spirochaetales bacterium]|nr:elongation factor Ts [Spirochaetales bacterium]